VAQASAVGFYFDILLWRGAAGDCSTTIVAACLAVAPVHRRTMRHISSARTILICGPTASGKSLLALRLAEAFGGVIINADSMQVYRELRILTARPTAAEEARAPHDLYGFCSGREAYSAGRYGSDAAQAIARARAQGRIPILVGGTGLYFKVLLEGLSPVPAIAPEVRAHWRKRAALSTPQHLHALLSARDPETAARIMPSDPQRIVRALEVLEGTGRSLASWQRVRGQPIVATEATLRLLVVPDPRLHATAIGRRFEAMVAAGALSEVAGLIAERLCGELPVMRALGIAPLAAHLAGRIGLEAALEAAKADTRHYAKRQATWFKRNMIAWKPVNTQQMESFSRDEFPFI
jgi:tRNA dimethylallyltransferase